MRGAARAEGAEAGDCMAGSVGPLGTPATDVEIDGIAELWYEDAAAMARAMASPEAKALHADGALFIGRIKSFTTVELEVVPGARGR